MADDILIVDDEKDIRALLGMMLEDEGYDVATASNANEARTTLLANPPKLAILDIWMRESDMDGIELLEWVKSVYPQLPVLMISGHGTIETAVQAMKLGAYDYLTKPASVPDLARVIRKAYERIQLKRENTTLRRRLDRHDPYVDMVGSGSKLTAVRDPRGPRGTDAIHGAGPRRERRRQGARRAHGAPALAARRVDLAGLLVAATAVVAAAQAHLGGRMCSWAE